MSNTIRWGILSTAKIAETAFIPSLGQTRRGTLAAVASRDGERARKFAKKHGAGQAFGSYEAMLASDAIDAVYIPLPNSMHAEWTQKAAAAGKHVFCEKPLGVSSAEAQRMVDSCRDAGVTLFEAFVFLYHPKSLKLRQVLEKGAIGDLVQMTASFTFPLQRPTDNIRMNRELGGGNLMDVGCYPIAYSRFVFNEEPIAVQAACRMDPNYGVDTRSSMVLTFSGDRHAALQSGFDAPGGQRAVIHGESGYIAVPQPCHPKEQDGFVVCRGTQEESVLVEAGVPPFAPAIEHFHDCVLDGVEPIATAANAIGTLRVIEAIRESAATGRRVELV
ncbi:MAG: Gfo/Idh/MocA family oxidoreductase [bacterium]|nr:Gfo/Idh/MocA family oxidoreductase [bacterium]